MEMRFKFNFSIVLKAFIHDGGQNQAGYEKDAKAFTNNFKSFFEWIKLIFIAMLFIIFYHTKYSAL